MVTITSALLLVLFSISHLASASNEQTSEKFLKKSLPSIVSISVTGRNGQTDAIGTGFLVDASGIIATNLHVIGEARPIQITFPDGKEFEVTEIVASDHFLDLALIRIPLKNGTPLPLAKAAPPEKGSPLWVIGNPQGLKESVVKGILSGYRLIMGQPMLQLAIPIEPGNSGGPVLNTQGEVIGIVTLKSQLTENLGFAIPVKQITSLMTNPNPISMDRWLTIGRLNEKKWKPLLGAKWRQRSGKLIVDGVGESTGGRSLCLNMETPPEYPFEVAVSVKLENVSGAAGLVFQAKDQDDHYAFYPSNSQLRLTHFAGPEVQDWNIISQQASPHYTPGEWNHLKVRIEKNRITCFVNHHPIIEHAISTNLSPAPHQHGLAKFRNTVASFKNFTLAPEIPPFPYSPETKARLEGLITDLPNLTDLSEPNLTPLVGQNHHQILLSRADELENRAHELRKIGTDVHVRTVLNNLSDHLHTPIPSNLTHTALLIAQIDDPDLQIDNYLDALDNLADEVKTSLPQDATTTSQKLNFLSSFLFEENGFHLSRIDTENPANHYLHRVIDDREGLPATLAILYHELAQRLSLNPEILPPPVHFLIRIPPSSTTEKNIYINISEKGELLTEKQAATHVNKIFFGAPPSSKVNLAPANTKEILSRLLRDLFSISRKNEDKEAMLRYLKALVALHPEQPQYRGLRGAVLFETGRKQAAINDMEWIIREMPEGMDIGKAEQLRDYFQTNKTIKKSSRKED